MHYTELPNTYCQAWQQMGYRRHRPRHDRVRHNLGEPSCLQRSILNSSTAR